MCRKNMVHIEIYKKKKKKKKNWKKKYVLKKSLNLLDNVTARYQYKIRVAMKI